MLIAITGGIGSGKSVVSRIVRTLGYEVYDCDAQARQLMDADPQIHSRIASDVCAEAIVGCCIDRRRLAAEVFSNPEKLKKLNEAVHGAVRDDLLRWVADRNNVAFVETAILYQSGLDRMVDAVWEVIAPREIRIERVMARNGLTAEEVMSRIDSQDSFIIEELHPHISIIINDNSFAILPQLLPLIRSL